MANQLQCTLSQEEKARIPTAVEKEFLESGAAVNDIDVDDIPSHAEKLWLTGQETNDLTGVTATEASWVTTQQAATHVGVDTDEASWLEANVANHALTDAEYARVPTGAEKEFLEGMVGDQDAAYANLGTPALADVDRIVVSAAWAAGALSIAQQPDVPRNVTATLTDADNSVTGTLTITGLDRNAVPVVEVMSPAGNGTGKTLTGTKIFASIVSCVISGTSGETGADLIVIGTGNLIGLPTNISNTNQVHSVVFNGAVVAAPTLAAGVSLSGVNVSTLVYNGVKRLEAYVTGTGGNISVDNIPTVAEKAFLGTNVLAFCLPAADEVSWVTANHEKNCLTADELTHLPSHAEKVWLTTEQAAGRVAVTVAERGVLTALLSGAAAFPLSLGAPILVDDDRIVESVDWDDGTLVIAAQPDVPRNIVITLTDGDNSTTGTITVTGLDINGRAVVETMSPDGAGNGKSLTGTKIFKTVSSVVISLSAGSGDDDHVIVGLGNLIGTPVDLAAAAEVVLVRLDGTIDADVTIATGVSTSGVNSSAHTYNGIKILDAIIQMGLT
jgi:hypothetical protein